MRVQFVSLQYLVTTEEAGVGVMIEGLEVAFEVSSEGSGKSKRRAKK